jgi:hypothetical protein
MRVPQRAHRDLKLLSSHSIAIPIAIASAAAIAYVVYRISVHRSAHRAVRDRHDLHSEVDNERETLRSTVEALPELLESAKRSRIGAAKLSELETDLVEAKLLGSQLPVAGTEEMDYSSMELDIQLAEILTLSIRANRLTDKYRRVVGPEPVPRADAAEELDAESLFEQAASIPAQARAQHAAFVAPS